MENLYKKSIIKLGLGLLLVSTFSYSSYANCKEGLSANRQAELISSLESYEPLKSDIDSSQQALKTSDSALQRRNEFCDADETPTDKYCLERRYMNDGFYIVTIVFRKEAETPVQPSAPLIKGSRPYKRDTTARKAFLEEWNDVIASEYLGSDYQSFHSVKLLGVHRQGVAIKLEVSDASELTKILPDPRVLNIYHIGSAPQPLEETP